MPFGLSGASLHAKTFAIDDQRIFIGSFNFDPRSATLNCEMGFLIDSPTIAGKVSSGFDGPFETISYQPELTPEDKMIWREVQGDGEEDLLLRFLLGKSLSLNAVSFLPGTESKHR